MQHVYNLFTVLATVFWMTATAILAQNFVRVTDTNNPIVNLSLDDYWTGVAWVDYDGDLDLDLFLVNRIPGINTRRNKLMRNDGDGNFTAITSGVLVNDAGYWFGTSWADYDNDGDLDCHVAGFPSRLYRNNGDGSFTRITSGAIGAVTLAGIGTAWSDYDNDGNIDLSIVWPNWMQGPPSVGQPQAPHLLRSDGPPNYTFTKVTSGPITARGLDTYLHQSWYDFDDDGDQDLFIGRGAGIPQPDVFYKNLLSETGLANFSVLTDPAFAVEPLEGQHWNFIDIDNDRDLDAFATSWASTGPPFSPEANVLFRNDNGIFNKVTGGDIVTDKNPSVTNVWGDFDNDGDLDCIVTTDSTYALNLYSNNGDGTFQKITSGDLPNTILHQCGASLGDYDGDGDLDVFVAGDGVNSSLFRNDIAGNANWIKLKLVGAASNRSGIGTKVFAKAMINGQTVWQRRDLSAANSFFGHNSLNIHFGLGDATVIDSLILEWPSGIRDVHTNIMSGHFYSAPEGDLLEPLTAIDDKPTGDVVPASIKLHPNFPNPFNPGTTIKFELPLTSVVTLDIYNVVGQCIVKAYRDTPLRAGAHKYSWNGTDDAGNPVSSGIYYYRLTVGKLVNTRKMILLR